ncbi:hypothetical protein RYX36_009977 [Vicia faba]
MAIQEALLDKPRKSIPKTFWLILSLAAIISSSALIATHLKKPTSFFHFSSAPNLCQHALDTEACLTHVSEVVQGPTLASTKDHKLSTLISLLTKSTTHIQEVMNRANVIKRRVNGPREETALNDCEQLMDLSMDRVWDSVLTLTKNNVESQQDAHTWLSSVLTNHATCLDGLEGASRAVMENDLEDLISRARSSLDVLVSVLPKPDHKEFIDDGMDATIITGSLNFIDGTTTFNSATVAAVGDGFIAQDIGFQNTAGPEKHQAVALRVGADQSVINRCKIDAFQDTLLRTSSLQNSLSNCFSTQNHFHQQVRLGFSTTIINITHTSSKLHHHHVQ